MRSRINRVLNFIQWALLVSILTFTALALLNHFWPAVAGGLIAVAAIMYYLIRRAIPPDYSKMSEAEQLADLKKWGERHPAELQKLKAAVKADSVFIFHPSIKAWLRDDAEE